jgi:iron complex transport system permease protein
MKIKTKFYLLGSLLASSILLGLLIGSANMPLTDLWQNQPILQLRLARVILGLLAGAGLGVCGVTLQAILKNPLAEPYLLGTSSGAGLGTILGVMLGITIPFIPIVAFGGALGSITLVYFLSKENGKISAQTLILAGVIISISFSGIIMFLISISSGEVLHGMMWWLLGSLQIFDLKLLIIVGGIVSFGIVSIIIFSQDLNALSIGEEAAIHLGISTEKIKKILFVLTALITGAIVSVSGIIGFVGLIIPHMLRLIFGPNHKILLPATCMGGATFLIFCDTLSRSLCPPIEIPIGVITALIGAPVFIILLKRKMSGIKNK